MLGPLLSLALQLVLAAPGNPADDPRGDPRAVVREATRAVQVDSVRSASAGWQARLARDSNDRAAALGLATLARLTYDYPTADRRYRALLTTDSLRPDRYTVYARLGLTQGLYTQGRQQEGDRLLARARDDARALEDRAAEGEALFWLAIVHASSRGPRAAITLLDSALSVIPESAQDLRAAARCRRAHMLVLLGGADASRELMGALAFARLVEEPSAEGYCLRALAVDLRYRDRADSSVAVYRTLEELRRRTRDRSGLARALMWRGDLLRQQAIYGEAREALHQALAEASASHDLGAAAEAKLLLGTLFLALNDQVTAARYVDQAVTEYAALGDSSGLMVSRSWRASVSAALSDFGRARREALEALEYFRRMGRLVDQWELYQTLADFAMREGDWAAAERALDQASVLMKRHGSTAWAAEQPFERGRLALARGDLTGAERAFTRHLAGLDPRERLLRYEARAYLADIYARRGDLARAERELTRATDELDRWRATLADKELRILAFQASQSEENDRSSSVARVLARLAGGGRAAAAFELTERRRARELVDRLAQGAALRSDSITFYPAVPQVGRSTEPVTAAEVAAQIPDGRTAILEYVTGAFGAPSTLFVLTRPESAGPSLYAFVMPPADSLTEPIARFVALLEAGGDSRHLGRALGDVLLGPALARLGPEIIRLIVVPDGPLHRIPWDALRLSDRLYVAERYAISIAPSAAVLSTLWSRARDRAARMPGPVRLLAFGNPTFSHKGTTAVGAHQSVAGETYDSAFTPVGGLSPLRASAREARMVARYAPQSEVRLGDEASAAYLRRAPLDAFRVLHFATHAVVDERSAARTTLALAPGGGEDGFLSPGDLATLKLDADLVVLSACRTAGGVVVDGEGVQGLTAPLLQAGARVVVATSWRIGDRSTVAFVDDFYRGLARGLAVGEALRAAKVKALRRGAPPSVWAAFMMVGDPLVRIPLRTPRSLPHWWPVATAALTLLLGSALAYSARMRRRRTPERRSVPSSAVARTHH
jgi:CHAT domain-containing protein/tetratricopeptide (TPR) repeat protein